MVRRHHDGAGEGVRGAVVGNRHRNAVGRGQGLGGCRCGAGVGTDQQDGREQRDAGAHRGERSMAVCHCCSSKRGSEGRPVPPSLRPRRTTPKGPGSPRRLPSRAGTAGQRVLKLQSVVAKPLPARSVTVAEILTLYVVSAARAFCGVSGDLPRVRRVGDLGVHRRPAPVSLTVLLVTVAASRASEATKRHRRPGPETSGGVSFFGCQLLRSRRREPSCPARSCRRPGPKGCRSRRRTAPRRSWCRRRRSGSTRRSRRRAGRPTRWCRRC